MSTGPHADRPPPFAEPRCTCAALRRTARLVTGLYDEALRPLGLKLTQYALLRTIRDLKAPSITRLAERMLMDRTTLTRNLAPLRKAGWVQVGGPDGRSRAPRLTREGLQVLDRAMPTWRQTEERVREILGEEEARQLRESLDAASRRLSGAQMDDGGGRPTRSDG